MRRAKIICVFLMMSLGIFTACENVGDGDKSHYKYMVVFGDSFSDNGNVYRLTKGYYPGAAYFKGRFSDGPTWAEYFAQLLHINPEDSSHFLNFAYGQAQIEAPYTIEITREDRQNISYSIPDLEEQISDYLKKPVVDSGEALFVIFIGTNDILNLGDTEPKEVMIPHLLEKLKKQLQRVIATGAHNILVINMRNLTFSPYLNTAAKKEVSPDAYLAKYNALIKAYNVQLGDMLSGFHQVKIYDAFAFDTEIHEKIIAGGYPYQYNGKPYILKFSGDGCYLDHAEDSCYMNKGNYQKLVSPICPDPQDYFFYDRVHPTTYAHKIMAEAVYKKWFEN